MANSTLGQKQRKFSLMIATLILYAYDKGYEISLGDAYRDPRLHGAVGEKKGYGHAKSAHKQRLAVDLNLYSQGVYLDTTEAHKFLGEKWEAMGGAWGGRFSDGNHYSLEHEGVK